MYVKRAQLLAEREYRGKIDKEKDIANAEVMYKFRIDEKFNQLLSCKC